MKELKEISKHNPFRVPENYFEEINRKILVATAGIETEGNKRTVVRKMNPYLAIAASIAVLVVIGFGATFIFKSNSSRQTVPTITLNEYADNYINDIDLLTLEENVAKTGEFLEESGLSKNDLVDYLALENIEINDIYEKL
jgi:hypothetical protein